MVWVHVIQVLGMIWVLGVCNMSLGMLCVFWNIYNMEGYECKMCPGITQNVFKYHKVKTKGANGRFGEKIAEVFLYLLHLQS
jgi:hypothetical protein